jgi:hypothetical protein
MLASVGAVLLLPVVLLPLVAEFRLTGEWEGIYLLKGIRRPLAIQNDLLLDEQYRLVAFFPFHPVHLLLSRFRRPAPPYLDLDWDAREGDGYVINVLDDKTRIVNCLSRFLDDGGKRPRGIFLGGGLPFDLNESGHVTMNDTGMAYFDGRSWLHAWCSINEFIAPASDSDREIYPSDWEFLGSRVVKGTPSEVILTSSHRVRIDGAPLRIDKYIGFQAGRSYLILSTVITNEGDRTAYYYFVYGDEPWVGNFGSSKGNVGWTARGLEPYETPVDTGDTGFIGLYDIGNWVIDEAGPFSRMANFLEWLGRTTPDLAYFSNKLGPLRPREAEIPLFTEQSRSLFLQWGPRRLMPGKSETYTVAQGLVLPNLLSPLPVKPVVEVPNFFRGESAAGGVTESPGRTGR